MACSLTLSGRDLPCRDAVGGVAKVWILHRTSSSAPYNGNFVEGMYLPVSSGEIAGVDATVISGTTAFYYDFNGPKNTSTFTQTVNSSAENGNVFYSQVLSLVLSKPVSEDVIELRNLTRGRLSIIVEDNNGNKFVMGHTQGVEATGGTLATGTAKGDLNGYTLEFTAEEASPAPLLGVAPAGISFDVTP